MMRQFFIFAAAGFMFLLSGYASAGGDVAAAKLPPAIAHSDNYKSLADGLKAGEASAQFQLGGMFYNGQGVPQDYSKAVHWFRKAARQGDVYAQYNLGVMYYRGLGVAESHERAAKWYGKAAEQGFSKAQHALGVMYENGRGVAKNYAQAAEWYRKAYGYRDLTKRYDYLGIHGHDGLPGGHAQARGKQAGAGITAPTTTELLAMVAAVLGYMVGVSATPVFLIPVLIAFYHARRPSHIFLYSFLCAPLPTVVFIGINGAQYAVSHFLLLYIAGVLLLSILYASRALIRKIRQPNQPSERLPGKQVKLNPFFCKSEGLRRLSIVAAVLILVCWVLFVLNQPVPNGDFPVLAGLALLVGFPIALYLIILALRGTALWVSRGFVSDNRK